MIKNFVLDTNVLLHDTGCIHKFEDNNVFLPAEILEEVDKFKTESSERGANARSVNRALDELFTCEKDMSKGVKTRGGGIIRVMTQIALNGECAKKMSSLFPDNNKMDNKILSACLFINNAEKVPAVLVSKDINMRLKARALGLEAEDYRNDKVLKAPIHMGAPVLQVSIHTMQAIKSAGVVDLDIEVLPNTYVLFQAEEDPKFLYPAKHLANGKFRRLHFNKGIQIRSACTAINPKNLEQQFLLDALYDDSVDCITVFGKAGTGKTLLAVASALDQVQMGRFDKVLATRAVVPMGNDIGFLPGTMEEKMKPWLQPIYDAIDLLMSPQKEPQFQGKSQSARKDTRSEPKSKGKKVKLPPDTSRDLGRDLKAKPYQQFLDSGKLEIQPIAQVRGRSIPHAIFLIDEAQNLSPHEAKTLVTRMAQGAKVVLMGDPDQIDTPYLDSQSNGLVITQSKLQGESVFAHVTLTKSERSRLAELASNKM